MFYVPFGKKIHHQCLWKGKIIKSVTFGSWAGSYGSLILLLPLSFGDLGFCRLIWRTVTCSCLARQARYTKGLIQTRVPCQWFYEYFTNIFTKILQTFTNGHPSYDEKMSGHICIFKKTSKSMFEFWVLMIF